MPDGSKAEASARTGDNRLTWLVLGAVLAAAGVVRFWGLDFGLPYTVARPDEARLVNTAVGFGSGDLNPHFFHYGSLYPYVLTFLFGIYYLLGLAVGVYSSVSDFIREFALDPSRFYIISRALSASLGTATVLVVYRAARELFDREVALLSSFFLALAYLHARDSHFGTTDVTMTFLIACSLLFVARSRRSRKATDYLLAGVFAGLATSTKYAGAFMIAPMAIVHVLNVVDARAGRRTIVTDRRMLLFGAALAAAFLAGTPYALVDTRLLLSDIGFEMNHLSWGNGGIMLGRGWWYHLRFTLFYGLGWPLLPAALAGILVLLKRDLRKGLILFAFPAVYYLYAGHGHTVFVRYMVPIVPFLCVAAALAVVCFVRNIGGALRPHVQAALTALLAVLLVITSVGRIVRFDSLMSREDNRAVAADWVVSHIPPGSSLWEATPAYARLQVNPGQTFLEKYARYEVGFSGALGGQVSRCVQSLQAMTLYPLWSYDSTTDHFDYESALTGTLPDYIITRGSPLKIDGSISPAVSGILKESYVLWKDFVAVDTGETGNRYDVQDIFYIPYAGFESIVRPGPNIYVYEKKSARP